MIRKLTGPGLALMAVWALTAVMASAASAQFTSNKEHTIYSGASNVTPSIFSAGEGFGGISCSARVAGTGVAKSESTIVLTPTYESCKDSFGRTVDVDNSGLTLTFDGFRNMKVSGGLTFTVTGGGKVVCTMVLASPQTDFFVFWTNLGGTFGIRMETEIFNLVSTTSGGFFNCGVSNGEHTGGTLEGSLILTGKDTSGASAEINFD